MVEKVAEKAAAEATRTGVGLFGLATLGVSITALVAALTKPVKAAEMPQEVIVDGDVRKALAALLLQGEAVGNSLNTANSYLREIVRVLGGMIPGEIPIGETPILVPFLKQNETLASGQNFPAYELTGGKGALLWAVIDVTDPNTKVIFRFDDLVWEFEFNTLYNEGVDKPLFPGVWLSKYDVSNSHYALIFSAGDLSGFTFKERCSIVIRYQGTGTATLTEGRGIVWNYA